ncbi:MAG TPA: GMC family oxidoreductase N-terminal domain-containing protein [Vicinamibacterales bacterium]|nr:GMC family oxidoreductase N-terminal domain-containing protein [Vicinamibacterales bacterium]
MSSEDTYDYIVVGGGSSGCVTANRLVAEHGAKVLLIERGPKNKSVLMRWPAGALKIILGGGKFTKDHQSEPQEHLGGRTIGLVQGNTLGGGSSVNVNAYLRGSVADYDRWTRAAGGFKWGWEELLPIFKRQEGNRRFDNEAHGSEGPLKINDPMWVPKSSEIFLRAMQRRGLKYKDDFATGDLRGVGFIQTTIHNAERCSAAVAFLAPVLDDPRLTVITEAEARKVLFDGNRAVGVEYVEGKKPRYAQASKEVILTAGPLVTPKILMHSGVGPKDHLAEHGLECLVDSPGVGQNFQDHPIISMTFTTKGAYGVHGADKGFGALKNVIQYVFFKSGPITANGSDVISFMNLDDPSAEPHVQIYTVPVMWPDFLGGKKDTHGLTFMANFAQPRSRGCVRLKSGDPADDLAVDFNWMSDPEDGRLFLKGFKVMREIAASEPFASIFEEERMPGADVQSDEELMETFRKTVRTNSHPVGTCKMGSDTDPMAVLTPDLRVRGVENLRVFDVSMMPHIISSAPNATAMAVAERGVELMMQD